MSPDGLIIWRGTTIYEEKEGENRGIRVDPLNLLEIEKSEQDTSVRLYVMHTVEIDLSIFSKTYHVRQVRVLINI